MTNNLSASKRVQIAARNGLRNKIYKSSIKTKTKNLLFAINDYDLKSINHNLSDVYSKIDKAVKKGVLHKNHGARKKAALNRLIKNLVSR